MKDPVNLETEALDQLEELVARVEALEFQLQQIFERNQRVETDKGWEIGRSRILVITILTFICTSAIFMALQVEHFFLSALVPTTGYVLSTLSLNYFKNKKNTPTPDKAED